MRQLGVIRDKQAFSAAEVAQEEYFFCGPSRGMFLFIPCLSRMTSEISQVLCSLRDSELAYYNYLIVGDMCYNGSLGKWAYIVLIQIPRKLMMVSFNYHLPALTDQFSYMKCVSKLLEEWPKVFIRVFNSRNLDWKKLECICTNMIDPV